MFYKSLKAAFESEKLGVNIEEADGSVVITGLKGSAFLRLKALFLTKKERYYLALQAQYFSKPCNTEEAVSRALKDLIADCDKLIDQTQPYLKARAR